MFRPIGNRALILPLEPDERTSGGIYLPDPSNKGGIAMGEVLRVGPGLITDIGERVPMDIEVGDIVMYREGGALDIEIEGRKLKVIEEEYVLGVKEGVRERVKE